MFQWKDGVLHIKKIDVAPIDTNIMSDLQESYRTYVTNTIYDDIKYLESVISDIKGLSDITIKAKVGNLVQQMHTRSQVTNSICYYPVFVDFCAGQYVLHKDVELVRIPYMDDYGRVNFQGNTKVVLGVQRASDDISYDASSHMLNIAMPHANIRIQSTNKGIRLFAGTVRRPLEDVIAAMLHSIGDDETNVSKLFKNTYILNSLKITELTQNMHVYNSIAPTGILQRYASPQYNLGGTRDALNETLTLDSAIGKRLSRDTLNYREGTVVTKSMVSQFIKNNLYAIYVYTDEIPSGYFMGYSHVKIFNVIPKGTRNCAFLRNALPEYADLEILPEELRLPTPLIIEKGSKLTEELVELFTSMRILQIPVKTNVDSSKVIQYSLETEVISNYTARLGDLVDKVPDGRSADEWVYCYNNPTYEPTDNSHLTPHDFMAIMSAMGRAKVSGVSNMLNRDTSFLKKVLLVNEVFSETLQDTFKEFVTDYKGKISSFMHRESGESDNPFISVTHKWMSKLNKEKYTAPIDATNILAEVSQSNHVNTITSKSSAVPDAMRHLSMPFFGRICPFETPAGAKLGLVNTKAIGAKIINGVLCAPYRKVISTSNGIRVSDKITYLSVKEEIGHKFGDLLTFKTDENGEFLNTPIVAKIPNPESGNDPFIFATINTFDLAGGYVAAYPEQFLSPTAATVPFACSTDPVRISYGLNQIRQAIYVHHTEKPLVQTFMYSEVFNYSTATEYKSTVSGIVKSIDNMRMVVKVGDAEEVVPILCNQPVGLLDTVIELLVKPNTIVNKGDVIAKANKYPQYFVVRAPYRCQILNITDNDIQIMRMPEGSFSGGAVNLDECDKITIENSRIAGQTATFMNILVSVGDVIESGGLLATTGVSHDGIYAPARNPMVAFVMDGYNHEDGISTCQLASYNYTSIIAHSVSKKLSKEKYHATRYTPLSGFNYCGANDVAGTIVVQSNNSSDTFDINVYSDFKHKGIPFEVTRADKDFTSRVYKWHMLDFKALKEGDKMSGLHGNKGVVSIVHKNSDMPIALNGRQVEFLFNPCGVPSRMNIGQIWTTHLSLVAEVLGIRINSDPFNGATPEDISYLMEFAHTLANTPDVEYNRNVFDAVYNRFDKLPAEMRDILWSNIANIIDWRGAFNPDGTATLYDPTTGTYFENDVTIGFPYIIKLVQEGEEKVNFRSGPLSHSYSRTTSQPMKGDNSANGQRMGEMELIAMASYGAKDLIYESCNMKSDNVGARVNAHCKQLGLGDRFSIPDEYCAPRSVENLLYMLEGVGVHVDVPPEICDTSFKTSALKYTYDLRKLVQSYLVTNNEYGSENSVTSVYDLEAIADDMY